MHALTSTYVYVLHIPRCARLCECSAPAICYCVCALINMYACFWWVGELSPVHLWNARVPACVCFTQFSLVRAIFKMFDSPFTRLSLLWALISYVHSTTWMHASDGWCNFCMSVPAMLVYLPFGFTWRLSPLHSFMQVFCPCISVFHCCELLLRVCTY